MAIQATRRQVIGKLSSGLVLAGGLGACGDAANASRGTECNDARAALEQHLTAELGDPEVAAQLTEHVADPLLSWAAARVAADRVDTVVVYAFGNRLLPDGTPVPGPMNAQLARTTADFVASRRLRLFAQWEVADILAGDLGVTDVLAIRPDIGTDGRPVYLSTEGVARKIVAMAAASGVELGQVGVIAWRDHAVRAVETSRRAGMVADVPEGLDLPVEYDPESGQPWTRSRIAYLKTDLAARLAARG